MAGPLAAKAATTAATSKTARRVVGVCLLLVAGLIALLFAPVAAVPILAASGGGGAPAEVDEGVTTIAGEWGLPMSPPYSRGRGFGYFPVAGCHLCKADHRGVDISKPCGAPLYAAAAGTVTRTGSYYDYGNVVFLDHGNDIQTAYGHLQWGTQTVQEGDVVDVGEVIGREGTTGVSTGCHLHFEVWVNGTRIDPRAFLARFGLEL